MGSRTINARDTEADRQERIAELVRDDGPDWAAPYIPGSFGCHELLDRTSLLADALEEQIVSHPSCLQNPEWFALADEAISALRALYQRIGSEHLDSKS